MDRSIMGVAPDNLESKTAPSEKAEDDQALLLQAGRGDRRAFGVLVERHHRAVIHFIHRFLGTADRDVAEDLAQDVLLMAWRAAPSYQPRARALTWFFKIATHACLNHRRRRRLRKTVSLEGDSSRPEIDRKTATSEEAAMAEERREDVRRAVASLPANQRATLLLRHYHELSYQEIADVLETSVGSVESLLFRARRTLGKRLAERKN